MIDKELNAENIVDPKFPLLEIIDILVDEIFDPLFNNYVDENINFE